MNFFGAIKNKIRSEKEKFRLRTQVKAELKARNLEKEAKYSKALGDKLKRQEKSNKVIQETKRLEANQRKEKLNKILTPLKNFQQQPKSSTKKKKNIDIFGNSSSSNDDFFKL